MRILRFFIAPILILCLLAGCSAQKEQIIVGTKYYTEQEILGNMLVLLIKEHTNLEPVVRSNMSSHVIFAAVTTGAVDVYVEYTGTIFGSYLNRSDNLGADEIYEVSSRELFERHELILLDRLGFNNTFCLAVRPETAEEFDLKTFSDLALVSSNFVFGGSAEILYRADGLPNLKILYNMNFLEELEFADEARYEAIATDTVQVTEAFSTDGSLMAHNLIVLEDDKDFFPPYEGVVVIRGEIAEKHPGLLDVLNKLSGIISDETMRYLNYRVDILEENPIDVATSFLKDNGLIR